MQSSIFLARAITLIPVTYSLLVLGQFLATCGEGRAIPKDLASKADRDGVKDARVRSARKSRRTDVKALLTVLAGISGLIVTTQLALVTIEQFAPVSIPEATAAETMPTYTPPNLGSPTRTLGLATR
ncbi:MAG: hypothetical protein SW833_11965 [Cyanobacteriota bacterium]|nr:hypothetical protein [Cyanobacteriota bacterium]